MSMDNDAELAQLRIDNAHLKVQLDTANMGKEDMVSKDQLDTVKRQAEMWRGKWAKLDEKLKSQSFADSNQSKKIQDLQDQVASLRENEATLQQQASLVPGLQSRLQEVEALKERVYLLEADVEAKNEVVGVFEKQHQELTHTNGLLTEDCAEKQDQINTLHAQVREYELDNEARMTDIEHERDSLKMRLEKALDTKNDLKEQVEQLKSAQPASDKEVQTLRTQVERLTLQVAEKGADSDYVAQLEKSIEDLDMQFADAVAGARDAQSRNEKLQAEIVDLQFSGSQPQPLPSSPSQDITNLRITNLASGDISPQTPATPVAHEVIVDFGDGEGQQTVTSSELEARVHACAKLLVENMAAERAAEDSSPSSNLNIPATINIAIDPADRASWTWLQKSRAALGQYRAIDFHGPSQHINELQESMAKHVAEFEAARRDVGRLGKEVKGLQGKLEGRPNCVDPGHRRFVDTLRAKEEQIDMQQALLSAYQKGPLGA